MSPADETAAFAALSKECEWSLIIAPESDGVLLERCRVVEEAGGRLLGPSSTAVALTGDKWALSQHFLRHDVPTPPCQLLHDQISPSIGCALVCKPRHGAGSQATFVVGNADELSRAVEAARREGFVGELLVLPFIPGQPVSVSFLIGPGRRLVLPAAEQHLSADGRFHYHGGRLPLPEPLNARAQSLAERAVGCVEGLLGYVGVDLVLDADPSADRIIEINPRLTTSYIGLRALAVSNLAAAMLDLALGREPPPPAWRDAVIAFDAEEPRTK